MTPPPGPAVVTVGLRKAYGEHVVLDDVDLRVPAGSVPSPITGFFLPPGTIRLSPYI